MKLKAKKPAPPKAYRLRIKLQALAERGINGERDAARLKLERLEGRFDFSAPDPAGKELFTGDFTAASIARPVFSFTRAQSETAPCVKWAIEQATGMRCGFRGDCELVAEATERTCAKLGSIAATISEGFSSLWDQYAAAGGRPGDRSAFQSGLYDGMMNETRDDGQRLPSRDLKPQPRARGRKKAALARPPGLELHPHSLALELGKRIRFSVPLCQIAEELEQTLKGQISV